MQKFRIILLRKYFPQQMKKTITKVEIIIEHTKIVSAGPLKNMKSIKIIIGWEAMVRINFWLKAKSAFRRK